MNKLFAAALIAGASQALTLNEQASERSFTKQELLEMAMQEGVNFDDSFKQILGPDFNQVSQLAQTNAQYTWTCNETFRRNYPENTTDVASVLAAGTKWSDPQYTVDAAMYGTTSSFTWKRMSD